LLDKEWALEVLLTSGEVLREVDAMVLVDDLRTRGESPSAMEISGELSGAPSCKGSLFR
jgi:hypothetical protein